MVFLDRKDNSILFDGLNDKLFNQKENINQQDEWPLLDILRNENQERMEIMECDQAEAEEQNEIDWDDDYQPQSDEDKSEEENSKEASLIQEAESEVTSEDLTEPYTGSKRNLLQRRLKGKKYLGYRRPRE